VGAENICANIAEALAWANSLYAEIADKALSVEHWGRRETDQNVPAHAAAAARD
jgi:hypothetical protein